MEAYLAELFKHEGYSVAIDQIIKGKCVEHEIDVVLTKGSMTTYVEAKFHNTLGFKTDLKTEIKELLHTKDPFERRLNNRKVDRITPSARHRR